MTDSLQDAQSPIVRLHDQPNWELTADAVAYPLIVQNGQKHHEIYIHLKPYSSDLLISILNAVPGSYRRGNVEVEMLNSDDAPFARLTDECFVRLDGTQEDNPEIQKQWLAANPRLKVRIARECLGGVEIDSQFLNESDPGKLELLPLALDCAESKTVATQELWDPVRKLKTRIRMIHTLRSETEQDWRKWSRTGNEVFTKATKEWKSNVNWWVRAEIYDAMVQSISGMTVNGEECSTGNKDKWLKLVPAWHKFLIVTNVFDELRVKNG